MKPKQIKVLSEMVLEETIQKSKNLFQKTVGNLKSFFFGGYRKSPRLLSCNPFYCGRKQKYQQRDEFYDDFYDEWESTLDKVNKRDSAGSAEPTKEEDASSGSYLSPKKSKQELGPKEKKQMGSCHLRKREVNSSSLQNANGGSYNLANRMKDFEMVDSGDVEQVLDVEEALHYYSRLKSPVYLDIVDKFFLDMYSDFSVPPESISSINSSKRRSGSQRLGSQRLGSIRY